MNVSLRIRLMIGTVISVLALLVLFSIFLYVIVHLRLIRQFDRSLQSTAEIISGVIERESLDAVDDPERGEVYQNEQERFEFELDLVRTPEFMRPEGGAYFQIWLKDGTVVLRSPSLGTNELPPTSDDSNTSTAVKIMLADSRPGRIFYYRFTAKNDVQDESVQRYLVLAVARDASELYGFLGFMRWAMLNGTLVVVALSTLVGFKVSKAGLRPLANLATEIDAVDEQTLSQSFAVDSYPPELEPICNQLNTLLVRIRSSFERERQFNSDVAHELRTPLAGIQSTIEVSLAHTRPAPEYVEALRNSLSIAKTMQNLVDAMLMLSRLDAQKISVEKQPLDLKPMIDSHWNYLADKATDRQVRFENNVPESCVCTSNSEYLGMIFNNALDNAVTYTESGGRIWVDVEQTDDVVRLRILNTGCQLSPDEISHVFEGFWRGDKARTATGSHCGIGLTVVHKIAAVLEVPIEVFLEDPDVFILQLELSK